ncbi:hypothetical protein O0L34_g8115 [Tuta absoluta]|nr:hypothetical protein O0L34_g8115 [Tuta absoluta]
MKVVTLLALALCGLAYATAGNVQQEFVDKVETHLGSQELHLHAGSDLVTEADQLASATLAELETRGLIADSIKALLESFRDVIEPLDPLHFDQIGPFSFDATGIRIFAEVRNFDLTGIKWYIVDQVTFSTLRLAFSSRVIIPWITATGQYDAEARIGFIGHSAGGSYRFFVNRLQTSVDIRVGTNIFGGGTLILRELDIDVKINDVTVQITGMVGSSMLNNIINSMVQNAAQTILVDQMQGISQTLSRELFDAVNDYLSRFSLDDIFG